MSVPSGIKVPGFSALPAASAAPAPSFAQPQSQGANMQQAYSSGGGWKRNTVNIAAGGTQANDLLEFTRKTLNEYSINGLKLSAELVLGEQVDLLFSSVVIRAVHANQVAIYAIAAEGSYGDARYPAATVKLPNGEVSVERGPMDALGARFVDVITEHVKAQLQAGSILIWSGVTYVPRDMSCSADASPSQQARVTAVIKNAVAAVAAEFTTARGEEPINLRTQLEPGDYTQVDISFGGKPQPNLIGVPKRMDITMALSTRSGNNKAQNVDIMDLNTAKGRGQDIALTGGYIDVGWMPGNTVMRGHDGMALPRPLAARLLLTSATSDKVRNLSLTVLAILSALPVRNSNIWWNFFRQRYNETARTQARTNVGALDVVVNIEARMRPQAGFAMEVPMGPVRQLKDDQDWGNFMNAAFQQSLAMGLHITAADPETWTLDPFRRSALGDKDSDQLIAALIDHITGGYFMRHWKGESVCLADIETVQTGTYIDHDDQVRPIEDVDLTAVCATLGDKNAAAAQQWINCANDVGMNFAAAMASRRVITDNVIGTASTVRGTSSIVMLRGSVLDAAHAAMMEAGVAPVVKAPGVNLDASLRHAGRWGEALLADRQYGQVRGGYGQAGAGYAPALRQRSWNT